MNMLRILGQNTLIGKNSPVRYTAERRRIKTVLQEIMYKAGRMIKTGRRWGLGLGENDKGYKGNRLDPLCFGAMTEQRLIKINHWDHTAPKIARGLNGYPERL